MNHSKKIVSLGTLWLLLAWVGCGQDTNPCVQATQHIIDCKAEIPSDFSSVCKTDRQLASSILTSTCEQISSLSTNEWALSKSDDTKKCSWNWQCNSWSCLFKNNCKTCRPIENQWPSERRCLPKGENDDPCDPRDHDDCDASQGLVCMSIEHYWSLDPRNLARIMLGGGRMARCLPPGKTGAPCQNPSQAPIDCKDGLSCVSLKKELPNLGTLLDPMARECRLPFENCSPCHYDSDCQSRLCIDHSFGGITAGLCCSDIHCAQEKNQCPERFTDLESLQRPCNCLGSTYFYSVIIDGNGPKNISVFSNDTFKEVHYSELNKVGAYWYNSNQRIKISYANKKLTLEHAGNGSCEKTCY